MRTPDYDPGLELDLTATFADLESVAGEPFSTTIGSEKCHELHCGSEGARRADEGVKRKRGPLTPTLSPAVETVRVGTIATGGEGVAL